MELHSKGSQFSIFFWFLAVIFGLAGVRICKGITLKSVFFSIQDQIGFIEPIKSWIATNWTKVTQYVEGILISESTVYRSRCWNCKTPIKSVKREHKIATWIGNKWLGNKMCESPDCTYFICVKCTKCLCDSHYYKRPRFVVQKNWEVEEKQNTVGKIVAYFSGEKMEIDNNKNQKRKPINF